MAAWKICRWRWSIRISRWEYEGKTLNVGGQLVENLQEDASLDFRLTDADDAAQGLADGTYYMVITIPQDFSSNAATLTDEQPREMELEYETNPGTNYIVSKLSETAMKEIQAGVREEVTKTYAETMFDQLAQVGDGMQEANRYTYRRNPGWNPAAGRRQQYHPGKSGAAGGQHPDLPQRQRDPHRRAGPVHPGGAAAVGRCKEAG